MANNYGHLLFLNLPQPATKVRFKARNPRQDKVEVELDSAELMNDKAAVFRQNLAAYNSSLKKRRQERSLGVTLPEIQSIAIQFHGIFNASGFEALYLGKYGLSLSMYYDMNKSALFTVVDVDLARNLFKEIKKLINSQNHNSPNYDGAIKYIKSFQFNSTENRVANFKEENSVVYLSVVENPLGQSKTNISIADLNIILDGYLLSENIDFTYNTLTDSYELTNATHQNVIDIAKNFDNVYSINSSSYTEIKPTIFGTPARGYPFSINTPANDLPTIGVIDTGVSDQTPLKSILVNSNNDYCITKSNPLVDNLGHGTSVAAFAALGTQLAGKVSSKIEADAKILSIKVLDGRTGKLSNSVVAKFIIKANRELGIKIFVLTVCYDTPMRQNELHSDYAFQLDLLAYNLGVLIFIAIGNYDLFTDLHHKYPDHFKDQETNLFSPSESMNNISIGSIGDNFEDPIPTTASKEEFSFGSLPAGYSRTYHIDYKSLAKPNGKLFKPDMVFGGGNYTRISHKLLGAVLESTDDSALQCLSIDPSISFERSVGTSFSTPLVANIAAKILRKFPTIRMQTVKALLINSSEVVDLGPYNTSLKTHHRRYVTGNGVPSERKALYSSDDEATIIIESTIKPGNITAIPIVLPDHLKTSKRSQSVLAIEATLCYSFKPVNNNQLAYCPVNISFGLMKNLPLDHKISVVKDNGKKGSKSMGINGNSKKNIAISSTFGWSQDAFYKSNILSNAQKISFSINRDKIEAEDGKFQIAISAQFHKLLPDFTIAALPQEYEFSLVIRLKENKLSTDKTQHSLYQDIQLLNTVQVLGTLSVDADLDAELT